MTRRDDPGRLFEQPTGGVAVTDIWQSTKQRQYEGEPMESQQFSPADYSLSATDLIPEDFEDGTDVRWLEYCRVASTLDRTRILEVILSDLDADDSPLYELIDSAIKCPHEPGRPNESMTVLAAVGKAILHLVARAVDDQVNLRMAVQEAALVIITFTSMRN
jgi:hypothetical protein